MKRFVIRPQLLQNSKLWEIDPGFLHLKHAFKTIFAILVVLACIQKEPLYIQVIASIICGFSMQGIVATSFRAQVIQIIMFDTVYLLAFLIGLTVNASAPGRAIVLVMFGFFANYIRRFGLQNSPAPFMGWCICFFATTLPLPENSEVLLHFKPLLLALILSGLTNLLILPRSYTLSLISNSNQFFRLLARGMSEIQNFPLKKKQKEFSRINFVKIDSKLSSLLWNGQAIIKSLNWNLQSELMNEQLLQQYALAHSYHIITDAYRILFQFNHQFPEAVQVELKVYYEQYTRIFSKLRIDKDFKIIIAKKKPILPDLNKAFYFIPNMEPRVLLILLNLKLSFYLLNQQIIKVVGDRDET